MLALFNFDYLHTKDFGSVSSSDLATCPMYQDFIFIMCGDSFAVDFCFFVDVPCFAVLQKCI